MSANQTDKNGVDMQEHVHTGFLNVVFVMVAWLVGYNLLKYASVKLEDYPQTQWISKLIINSIATN